MATCVRILWPAIFVHAAYFYILIACAEGLDKLPQEDASDVTWAHAVNSREELRSNLAGDVDFLETDISMGHIHGFEGSPIIPIMAHPPKNISDISLESWLEETISANTNKGVKLDFKTIAAVEPSLKILKKHGKKVSFPLWLNADILSGPVNSPVAPVPPVAFLQLCREFFPNATLSLGWTTTFYDFFAIETLHYGWDQVRAMADVVRCFGPPSGTVRITFPVRAVFLSRSIPQLQWLLDTFEGSSLTVWSPKNDPVDVADLLMIRSSFKVWQVYYDVADPLKSLFNSKKNLQLPPSKPPPSNNWYRIDHGTENVTCASHTYISSKTVVFGQDFPSAALLKKTFHMSEDFTFLRIEGFVEFFTPQHHEFSTITELDGIHELTLVLSDVSAFRKDPNGTLEGGMNDLWSAMNQSHLHVFRHDFNDGVASCRFFRLDTSAVKAFQAWTIPCDMLFDDLPIDEIIKREGLNEIPNDVRLVLPSGDLMFGIMSAGTGHAVVYNLKISGVEPPVLDSRGSAYSVSTLMFSFIVFIYAVILFV